jgi:hypothetical protein
MHGANRQDVQYMHGTRTNGVLGLGEAAGARNLLKTQLRSQSTLGTARGEERVLLIGHSTDGMEMHGIIIMPGRVIVGMGGSQ